MVSVESTPQGVALLHLITTDEAEFAFRLYWLAASQRISARFYAADRCFTLEFLATQSDADAIIGAAR